MISGMRTAVRCAALLLLTVVAACSKPPEPLQVESNAITVLNQTDHDWKDIVITVNDHYRGGAPLLRKDGRLNAPISQFETGFGQRWPAGQRITKVVMTAKSDGGEPVKLEWDINQPKPAR
jgi:hypothetical protein